MLVRTRHTSIVMVRFPKRKRMCLQVYSQISTFSPMTDGGDQTTGHYEAQLYGVWQEDVVIDSLAHASSGVNASREP